MPRIENTGWSTATPDPTYLHSVHDVYNRFVQQLHTWGDNVNWNLPQITPNPLLNQASTQYQQGSDVLSGAWNRAGQAYTNAENTFNMAGEQFKNLANYGAGQVQLGAGVYDTMKPELEKLFGKYDLSNVDALLAKLGSPDLSKLSYSAPTIGAVGSATGATATGATVSAVDPNRKAIRDVQGINSIDELQSYLNRVDSSAFSAMQQAAERDLERQRQIQMQQIASQAAAQNAFGGGRHGVVEAETNRAALDAQAKLAADMQMRKLEFANAILQTDIGRRMTAQQLNQAADIAAELERARLGTQANIATGQNITQANIATAQNQTQASIANADAQTRAAIAQAQIQGQLEQSLLASKAHLLGQEYAARGDIIRQQEALKPVMIQTQGGLLSDLAKTQYLAESAAATKNAELYQDWLNYQSRLGEGMTNLGSQQASMGSSMANAGTTIAAGYAGIGAGMRDLGKYLTDIDTQNQWTKWYGDYMYNMWQPMLTGIEHSALLSQPYGTTNEFFSNVNRGSDFWNLLSLIGQLGGAALTAFSDPKLKSNVKDIKGSSLDRISKLRPVEYSLKADEKKERLRGLLADEVSKASPSYAAKIGAYNAVNLEPIIADIVGAIKELSDKRRKNK